MATTHIHAIIATVGKAVGYGASDKVENSGLEDIKDSVAYARNDKTGEVIYKTLTSTLNCPSGNNIEDVTKDFMELIDKYNDTLKAKKSSAKREEEKNPLAWHLVQSFEGYIPPTLANQIGKELAEEFLGEGWRVQISTHTNTENIHNHIIFCSWNENGKKYHACNDTYNKIREISDRICESYGLQILENTRRMKLIKWTDKEGKTHYYEPTQRKNELLAKRSSGTISLDDVNSYRNSENYQDYMRTLKSNQEIVKHDIDMYLPFALSYEHLLNLLREYCGYKIKDKTKNGGWREHVTFLPPTADKGVRDNHIGDGVFYLRENLEKYISEQVAEQERKANEELEREDYHHKEEDKKDEENTSYHGEKKSSIPLFDDYTYSNIDVKMLDERLRAVKKENGDIGYIRRGVTEKTAIKDIKKKDVDLYAELYKVGYNTTTINEIIKRQQQEENLSYWQLKKEQEEYIKKTVEQIQERLNILRFMESNSLHTYEQLNTIIRSMWEKYNQCFAKVNEAEKSIYQLEGLLQIEERLRKVQERMKNGRTDKDYVSLELQSDKKLEQKYLYMIDKYKLKDPQEVRILADKIERMKSISDELKNAMEKYKEQLSNYERCVEVLRECDLANEKAFSEAWQEYDDIEKAGKDEEQSNSNERKQHRRLER